MTRHDDGGGDEDVAGSGTDGMIFQQYYLECLSHASYLIGDESSGRAVVVDPRRDVSEYLRDAEAAGLRIELVIETHFHADFLSGHLELAEATGSEIAFGEAAAAEFPIRRLRDGERISLGQVTLEIRSTPGHTPESICVVVHEHPDAPPYGVLTGDTLFIGDVGRPDLLSSVGIAAEDMAADLYRSLHEKLLTLPDATRVYPAHGAGSACGKNLSTETVSTIGEQRRTNYALVIDDLDRFVAAVTEGQPEAPAYFAVDAALNRRSRELLHEDDAPPEMSVDEVLAAVGAGAVVVDTREPAEFAAGHLVGSVNVGLGGRYAEFAGAVVDHRAPIVVVSEPGRATEAKVRLARIGFDGVIGQLRSPRRAFVERPDVVRTSSRLTADQLDRRRREVPGLVVVDVRAPGEVAAGTIEGAVAVPVTRLRERLDELDRTAPTVVFCAGGYRSSIASSVLRAHGFEDVSDLLGGYGAWSARAAA